MVLQSFNADVMLFFVAYTAFRETTELAARSSRRDNAELRRNEEQYTGQRTCTNARIVDFRLLLATDRRRHQGGARGADAPGRLASAAVPGVHIRQIGTEKGRSRHGGGPLQSLHLRSHNR